MITLYQFAPAFGLPNASSFCMKVETYLRLTGLEYDVSYISNPSKAPKGKCPYIKDGDKVIADSHFALKYLKETYGDPLGEGLSAIERAGHLVITRMLEEHLYFTIVYDRWVVPENAAIVRDVFFKDIPGIMRKLIFSLIQKKTKKTLFAQGMGRHTHEEIISLALEDIGALSDILGSDPFFGGQTPLEIDCVTWSFIANLVQPREFNSKICDAARQMPNLVDYHERMKARVFPELG